MPKEDQLQTLIGAAVRKAVEDTTAKFDSLLQSAQDRNDALAVKNRELLSKKKALQGKSAPEKTANLRERLSAFDAETDRMLADAQQSEPPARRAPKTPSAQTVDMDGAVVLDRADPRVANPDYYRTMRDEAAKRGVPVRFIDSRIEASSATPASFETFDDTIRGVRWMRRDLANKMGIVRAHRLAKRDGLSVRTFDNLDDLPAETREKINDA